MMSPESAQAWRRAPVSMFLGTCAGIGHLPGGPGTYAAAAAIPFIAWMGHTLPLPTHVGILVLVTLASFYWCDRAGKALDEEDSSKIVIDEWVGVWWALVAFVEPTWLELLVGFVAFRVFDIAKPPPVGTVDKRVKGGVGVMLDDLLAGALAFPFVWAVRHFVS